MKKPSQKEVYTTVIVLSLAVLIAGRVFHLPKIQNIAILLLALSLFFYAAAEWVAIGWLKFAEILGNINSKILITIIFFVFLVPISFLYRIFNKDNLHLKKKEGKGTSTYIVRNHKFEKKEMEKTW